MVTSLGAVLQYLEAHIVLFNINYAVDKNAGRSQGQWHVDDQSHPAA